MQTSLRFWVQRRLSINSFSTRGQRWFDGWTEIETGVGGRIGNEKSSALNGVLVDRHNRTVLSRSELALSKKLFPLNLRKSLPWLPGVLNRKPLPSAVHNSRGKNSSPQRIYSASDLLAMGWKSLFYVTHFAHVPHTPTTQQQPASSWVNWWIAGTWMSEEEKRKTILRWEKRIDRYSR